VGIAASVASEKLHRGDHRVWISVMTDDKVVSLSRTFDKGIGRLIRWRDGKESDVMGLSVLLDTLSILDEEYSTRTEYTDATELATQRFWTRPFFLPSGQRLDPKDFKFDADNCALMPGAFHPPHEGHLGLANQVKKLWGTDVVFEVCATHPIKPALTVQQMLQRAKMLRGHHTLFTQLPLYIDKARAYPNVPIIAGADAIMRILDPQWGDPATLLKEFAALNTEFFIGSRLVDGKLVSRDDIVKMVPTSFLDEFPWGISCMFRSIPGQWDVSSTEIRNNKLT
jgi:nicotinic acid mononucleotide adenylyltransferase